MVVLRAATLDEAQQFIPFEQIGTDEEARYLGTMDAPPDRVWWPLTETEATVKVVRCSWHAEADRYRTTTPIPEPTECLCSPLRSGDRVEVVAPCPGSRTSCPRFTRQMCRYNGEDHPVFSAVIDCTIPVDRHEGNENDPHIHYDADDGVAWYFPPGWEDMPDDDILDATVELPGDWAGAVVAVSFRDIEATT